MPWLPDAVVDVVFRLAGHGTGKLMVPKELSADTFARLDGLISNHNRLYFPKGHSMLLFR